MLALSEIHYLGLLDVSERIRRRELTSEAVTQALLERIDQHELSLNSILMLLADSALEQARKADAEIEAGLWRGPLHGVPIGIKDLLWTRGLPTTAGTEILRDFRPTEDATVVTRLKHAGAVLIAKLHMAEAAANLSHHPNLPRPVNPWNAEHWTGVTSSGSGVATAAGFCFGAIGTDTGGSIRLPSAANNLTGIKPTWGRVSRHGLLACSETFDHVGPMARSAADAAAILQVIAGYDYADPTSLSDPVPDYLSSMKCGVSGLVLGIDWNYATEGVAEPVVAALRQALDIFTDLGVVVREFTFPWSSAELDAYLPISGADVAVAHAAWFPARAEEYGSELRTILEAGHLVKATDLARAQQVNEAFKGRLRTSLNGIDFMLTPTIAGVLPSLDQCEDATLALEFARFTCPFNMSGIPALSLPGGFTEDELPIGLQLAGPWSGEVNLLRAGVALQRVTDFHTRHPRLDMP